MRLYSIKTTVARLALTGYLTVLVFLSLRPATGGGRGAAVAWGLHLIAYLGLGLLVAVAFPERFERHRIRSVIEVAMVGLVLEIVQAVLPTRTFSLIDVGMNAVGAGLAWFAPTVRRAIGQDRKDGQTEQADEITAGDLEGQTPRPQDMRMFGDREQDRGS